MGYRIERRDNTWRLLHRIDHGKNGTELRVVSKKSPEFQSLGLNTTLTFEQAKTVIANQRVVSEVKRLNERKAKIFKKVQETNLVVTAWLPNEIVREFETRILPHKAIKPLHWRKAKTLIEKVTISPSEWSWMPEMLSNQLIDLGHAWDYSKRVWTAVQAYGAFYCYKTGTSWSGLPRLTTQVKNKIYSKYEENKGDKHVTFPLSADLLPNAQKHLTEREYNWLRVALFFGLRIEEMDAITLPNIGLTWFISTDDNRFKFVLNIYQQKLQKRGIMKKWLWKAIPACEQEQVELLEIIQSCNFEMPSIKKLKRWVHPKLVRRSCRRGFSPWLTSKGYSTTIVAVWLGHVRHETYMHDKHYGNPHVVSYEAPFKKTG